MKEQDLRIIISGGGTGGHVYPALAIAEELRKELPQAQIRFIGAKGKMEMEKVPEHGFPIDGLWISGFQRKNLLKNILLPFKILSSFYKVNSIISDFKPNVVVGVGGYASGPLLYVATRRKIPALIQEQNSYPGATNKILSTYAKKICVAYPGLEKFFPKDKLVLTGNPVRDFSHINEIPKQDALDSFKLEGGRPTLLVLGGSLGSRTINQTILKNIDPLLKEDINLIWQTGKFYYEEIKAQTGDKYSDRLRIYPFIDRMDNAYASADAVISRAGAISISELALAGKATILVPSPNVAEDHQTKNAKVLVEAEAAILVKDNEAGGNLVPKAISLIKNSALRQKLAAGILNFARPNAAREIADEIIRLAEGSRKVKPSKLSVTRP